MKDGRRLLNAPLSKPFASRSRMEQALARIKKEFPDAKGVMEVDLS